MFFLSPSHCNRISPHLRATLAGCIVSSLAVHIPAQEPPQSSISPARKSFPDPLNARPLNPIFDLFPDSSLADFSTLLDAPAGKHGFLGAKDDGHFYFEDGVRVRFWGVTITQEHIDIPKERIDVVVDNLARAGCNMVRFHSLDNPAGFQYGFARRTIIDDAPPHEHDTQHFDAEYRDRLDYWIARLKERGIYSFIVLRGFRTYHDGDGVPNPEKLPRGATPFAFFNKRLIELQIQFARDLLFEHVNPYTKLPLGKDPAVALIEVFNEDSLFSRPNMWHEMIEPYGEEFRRLWTDYLKRSYGNSAGLRKAWTNSEGKTALQSGESLESGNIALPDMAANESFERAQSDSFADPAKSPARRRDAVRFAVELQRNYFKQMIGALTEMGLKVPATGVVAGISLPDTFSAAQEFGFTAENMYQEHPSFEPGREWQPPFYYENGNYLWSSGPYSAMPFVTRYRWSGKPVAVREWATCWPNQYRASSILEMASYGRFQDLDALIYFAYYTTGDFTRLGSFDLNNDPARWSLYGLGAQIFLGKNTVAPAERLVQIGYSPEDLSAYSSWMDPLHTISWVHRTENAVLTPDFEPSGDLFVMSGRSHSIGFSGKYGLLFSNAKFVTAEQHEAATGEKALWQESGYALEAKSADGASLQFNNIGYNDSQSTSIAGAGTFSASQVRKLKLEPIGVDKDRDIALGAYDEQRKNLIFSKLPLDLVPRFAFDLTNHWYETPMDHASLDRGVFISDTNELVRDTRSGVLTIDTPTVQVIQGMVTTGTVNQTPSGKLKVISSSPFAVIAAISLDGKPLNESNKYTIKMVTIAENRKQSLEPAKHPAMKGKFVMSSEGSTPIVTKGIPTTATATQVFMNGRELISAGMVNGTWELLIERDRNSAYLFCDTINVPFKVNLRESRQDNPAGYTMQRFFNETAPPLPEHVAEEFTYPAWAKYIALTFK